MLIKETRDTKTCGGEVYHGIHSQFMQAEISLVGGILATRSRICGANVGRYRPYCRPSMKRSDACRRKPGTVSSLVHAVVRGIRTTPQQRPKPLWRPARVRHASHRICRLLGDQADECDRAKEALTFHAPARFRPDAFGQFGTNNTIVDQRVCATINNGHEIG